MKEKTMTDMVSAEDYEKLKRDNEQKQETIKRLYNLLLISHNLNQEIWDHFVGVIGKVNGSSSH